MESATASPSRPGSVGPSWTLSWCARLSPGGRAVPPKEDASMKPLVERLEDRGRSVPTIRGLRMTRRALLYVLIAIATHVQACATPRAQDDPSTRSNAPGRGDAKDAGGY